MEDEKSILALISAWESVPVSFDEKKKDITFLILYNDDNIISKFNNYNTVKVKNSNKFETLSDKSFYMDFRSEEDFIHLQQVFKEKNIKFQVALNLVNFKDNLNSDNVDDKLSASIYLNLYLIKHVIKYNPCSFMHVFLEDDEFNYLHYGLEGFFKVIKNEIPSLDVHLIQCRKKSDLDVEKLISNINSSDVFIKYENNERFIRKLKEADYGFGESKEFSNGNYLILGGCGGLGRIFASFLLSYPDTNVIIAGRSQENSEKVEDILSRLNTIRNPLSRVSYYSCNAVNEYELLSLEEKLIYEYGDIKGIFNFIGINNDALVLNKESFDFKNVVESKIKSTLNIMNMASNFGTEFIILFSSIASVTGTIGQADYAYGNSVLNSIADLNKNSKIKIYSIAWPLWQSKGMMMSDKNIKAMENEGFYLLDKESGINTFKKMMCHKSGQSYILFYGIKSKIFKKLGLRKLQEEREMKDINKKEDKEYLMKYIKDFIKGAIAKVTKHNVDEIDDYDYFDTLGIDSIKMIEIIDQIEAKTGILPKTLFFEYQSVNQLVRYIFENFADKFVDEKSAGIKDTPKDANEDSETEFEINIRELKTNKGASNNEDLTNNKREPIAIIGMSGKLPKSNNLKEFWNNLLKGEDCIVEIPKERWDYKQIYEKDTKTIGKTNSKWGGFLDNIDYFDAQFFKYSPIEAAMIDPQERLFIETVWNCMENAAYTRKKLKEKKVGVYVGVSWGHYQFYDAEYKKNTLKALSSFSSIANRVSYFFNLNGPSIAVDTMCSSSGTAIDLAAKSIWSGECNMAFAGGVNLTVDPVKYQVLSTKGYLSSDGRCRSFGEGGDGYVPGEGVGCILLKPLKDAILDHDNIQCVILSTAINHGGRSTGYSVPNPKAQGMLIEKAIKEAEINPEEISYIETHGTGTKLGDPIEILGLNKGLDIKNHNNISYKIGSVKSNIGHLESAAAIAALFKVILQMQNNKIVKSLHSENLNQNIDFEKLPYEVVQEVTPWKDKNLNSRNDILKSALISSFGAGGSNFAMVVGKYHVPKDTGNLNLSKNIIVISAMNKKSLQENIKNLYYFINNSSFNNNDFFGLCYTLQLGREEMNERLAFVSTSIEDTKSKLKAIINKENSFTYYINSLKGDRAFKEESMNEDLINALENDNLELICEAFVKGEYIDWQLIYNKNNYIPVSMELPTYSFDRKRYWISDYDERINEVEQNINLHKIIDSNNSTLDRQLYTKVLTGNELYLSNHIVKDKMILPGSFMLEFARKASADSMKDLGSVTQLRDVVFKKSVVFNEDNINLNIELFKKKNSLGFVIKENRNEKEIIYASGNAAFDKVKFDSSAKLDKSFINDENKAVNKEDFYHLLNESGFQYGDYFKSIEEVYLSHDKIYAKLNIKDDIEKENESYVLKLSIIDGALQSMALFFNNSEEGSKYLPYKIDKLNIFNELTSTNYVTGYVIDNRDDKLICNIDIYNDKENLAVSISGYTVLIAGRFVQEEIIDKKENINVNDEVLRKSVRSFVVNILAKETGTPVKEIKDDDLFEKYGLDSIISMRITDELNTVFKTLSATFMYEFKEVGSLIQYLLNDYYDVCLSAFKNNESRKEFSKKHSDAETVSTEDTILNNYYKSNNEDIAIIGIDGRYPKADNLDEFWNNLTHSLDCVEEIPRERWDYQKYYSNDKNAKGKIYSKWGGFINGAEEFDNEFFGIVPLQAIIMDPQERIYLQTVWHTFEDAGYSLKSLSKYNVGVYTGEMWGDYQKIGVEETQNGNVVSLSSSFASVSNKVSYMMNLHGPSMTVDTMCSSSLTSIYLACQALHDGSVDMAIAGGVNLTLHPDKYISLCQGKFLSSEGKCRSFGEGGDGYVPGEGVGAVLLKPLSKAERDNDHIYAVIKACSINHGGKSNAYFVPNVEEQKNLIVDALNRADISPRTISSVEAHGTGTALGDPIEVKGFKKAYSLYTDDKQYCSLGSVKSNIGHLESAAGIAAVTKVVLEMKNKKLVPSIHSEVLNKKIDFENSPFYVQHKLEEWKRPIIYENKKACEYPRRAAISAFGAGGTNVHIILEEYEHKNERKGELKNRIFVFSAKSFSILKNIVSEYITYLTNKTFKNENEKNLYLGDMANTLYKGREAFKFRVAIIAESLNELIANLNDFINKNQNDNVFSGEVNGDNLELNLFDDEEGKLYINSLIKNRSLTKLAMLWISGVNIDLNSLVDKQSLKIHLPFYPFAKNLIKFERTAKSNQTLRALSVVIDENISTINSETFVKEFKGNEFYLEDHKIGENHILPGVIYIEMIRSALELSVENSEVTKFKNIYWNRPITVNKDALKAYVSLKPLKDKVNCLINTKSQVGMDITNFSCEAQLVKQNPNWHSNEKIDFTKFQNNCLNTINKMDFYEKFSEINYIYGARMQGINKINFSNDFKNAVVFLNKKENLTDFPEFTLHPAVLDAGIQAAAVLINDDESSYLPYSIQEIEVFDEIDTITNIVVTKINKSENTITFNLIYTREDGKVILKITGLILKKQKQGELSENINFYTTSIKTSPVNHEILNKHEFLLFDEDYDLYNALKDKGKDVTLVLTNKVANEVHSCDLKDEESIKNIVNKVAEQAEFNVVVVRDKSGYKAFNIIKSLMMCHIKNKVNYINFFKGEINSVTSINADPLNLANGGLFKTAAQESNKFCFKNIAIDNSLYDNKSVLAQLIIDEGNFSKDNVEEIFYKSSDERYLRTMEEVDKTKLLTDNKIINSDGVYLITGGLKGVGYIFAHYIAKKYKASVVLLGRSPLDKEGEEKLNALRKYAKQAEYYSIDVIDLNSVISVFHKIRNDFGKINGVIHGAGVKKDELIVNKNASTFKNTIKPKVIGINNLVKASENDNLDFIVTFSSLAGLMGNVGQADYAYANNYLDAFAFIKRQQGLNIISFNWPYWQNGGMKLKEAEIESMKKRNGLLPLKSLEGLTAFEKGIANLQKFTQILVLSSAKLKKEVKSKDLVPKKTYNKTLKSDSNISTSTLNCEHYLKYIISDETKIPINKIDNNLSFEAFGFDSIMNMNMTARIEEDFPNITKTLFYENHNINELIAYLKDNYSDKFKEMFEVTTTANEEEIKEDIIEEPVYEREIITFKNNSLTEEAREVKEDIKDTDIACIALNVKVPDGNNLKEFFNNLLNGKNSIEKVPEERFNVEKYYDEKPRTIGKTYCKLGGFIDGISEFDPLFFNIAPNNAAFIDPLERILLQEVYHLFENAGIVLSKDKNRDIGVFIGAMWQQYQMLLMNGPAEGMIPSLFSNLSNRISSFYDLNGPSLTLDTMCSSSLTALHIAINSIRNKECSSAIVGGINLSLHESKYINLSQGGLLSKQDRCIPFGEGADGYIPSEGVGLIMIKPLWKAIEDNDDIKLVIKGSSLLHSGRGSGFMTPNLKMQQKAITKTLDKCNVDIETISYVEAQGICTEVGDAMEFKAINNAFKEYSKKKHFTALGSAKYCIGHTEAASGLIAFAKIAMQMKKGIIPGILSNETINKEIDIDDSAIYIPQNNIKWQRLNKDNEEVPRRALLNGFGGAGAYVTVLLEEYINNSKKSENINSGENAFIFSAKSKNSLVMNIIAFKEYLENLNYNKGTAIDIDEIIKLISEVSAIDQSLLNSESLLAEISLDECHYLAIIEKLKSLNIFNITINKLLKVKTIGDLYELCEKKDSISDSYLRQIAYNLQNYRESYNYKAAFIASDEDTLLKEINKYLGSPNRQIIFSSEEGNFKNDNLKSLVNEWIEDKNPKWDILYEDAPLKKLELPSYKFDTKSYYLSDEMIIGRETEVKSVINNTEDINNVKTLDKEYLAAIIEKALGVSIKEENYDRDLQEFGLDSFTAQKIFQELSVLTSEPIKMSNFTDVITINYLYEKIIKDNIVTDKFIPEEVQNNINENNDEYEKLILMQLENGDITVEDAIRLEDENE